MNISKKAIFLDRDGTLIVDRNYLADPAGVELISGVRESLHRLLAKGWSLFLFSNQSGVGRGLLTLESVQRCNSRMLDLLGLPQPGFTEICIATEAPGQPSRYRKPSPQFITEMLVKHSFRIVDVWMVGDKLSDVQVGLNAGVRSALLQPGKPTDLPAGVWQCRDLAEFSTRLIQEQE